MPTVPNPIFVTQDISVFQGETPPLAFVITDQTGAVVNVSADSLRFVVYTDEAGTQTTQFTLNSGSGITVTGQNQVNVTPTAAQTGTAPLLGMYALWDLTTFRVLNSGRFEVKAVKQS